MSFGSNETRENNSPIRVEFPSETPTHFSLPKNTAQTERKGLSVSSVLAVISLLLAIGLGAGAAAYFVFVKKDEPIAVSQTNAPIVQTGNSNETQELKKELERLKKQVEEQKNAKTDPTVPPVTATPLAPKTVSARVNSPNDGFLALRTAPGVKSGDQILQIPHGAEVEVSGCQSYTTIGSKRGRWCRVKYENQEGWSFDAFLIY